MKILPITLTPIKTYNTYKNQNKSTHSPYMNTAQLPIMTGYLAFLGGYSQNLNEVYRNLDPAQYPSDTVRQNVQNTVAIGNPQNLDLHDIHFDYYKKVLDCYTMEDLKKIPEFEQVNSVYDVLVTERTKSFLGDFLSHESEIFPNSEDLTLQLIKLYWGKGYSLSMLSDYIAQNSSSKEGINLYYAMTKKLNIPTMNRRYACVLQLSNEDFMAEMKKKRELVKEEKRQKEEGEPVIIPSDIESENHAKFISNNLEEHFEHHPETLSDMTQRQKTFYKNNPDRLEELRTICSYAMSNTPEGKTISKVFTKFMKNRYNLDIANIDFIKLGESESEAVARFWRVNSWAVEKFEQAFEKAKAHFEETGFVPIKEQKVIITKLYPKQIIKNMEKWAKENHYPIPKAPLGMFYIAYGAKPYTKEEQNKAAALIDLYFKNNRQDCQHCISSGQVALISIMNSLDYKNTNLPKNVKKHKKLLFQKAKELNSKYPIYQTHVFNGKMCRIPISGVAEDNIDEFSIGLIAYAIDLGLEDFPKYYERELESAYKNVFANGKNGARVSQYLGY